MEKEIREKINNEKDKSKPSVKEEPKEKEIIKARQDEKIES